jgi:hypothetical protein
MGGEMKTRISGALGLLLSVSLLITACSAGTKVPDVSGADAETAKTVLTSLGFIPTVTERASDSIDAGIVIESNPPADETLTPGSKVEVVVSSGPRLITSVDGTAQWTGINTDQEWQYDYPYIEDGTLYITFIDLAFEATVEWWDPNMNGNGFGQASISDTFDKTVPIKFDWDRQSNEYGQGQTISLEIPIRDLDVQKPTTMFLKLFSEVNGQYKEIGLDLTFAW